MITHTEIRNALTGALAIMALGLFASCADTPLAPVDDGYTIQAPSENTVQEPLQSCTLVDGVWVCTSTGTNTTTSGGGLDHCRVIYGVWYCPPESLG
jgi:hypothetical protein